MSLIERPQTAITGWKSFVNNEKHSHKAFMKHAKKQVENASWYQKFSWK